MGTVGQPDDKGILQPDDKITGDSLSPETSEPPPPSVQKAMDAVIEVTSGSSESFQGTVDTSALPRGTKAPPPPSPVGIKKTNPPTNTDEVLKANIEGDRNAFAFFISKKSVGEESKLIWVGNQDDMTTIMSQDDAKSKEIELAKKEGRYILGHGQTNITVGGSPEARAIIADLQAKFDADPDRQLFETYDDLSPDLSDRLNQNMNRFTSILRNPEVPGLELNEMTEGQSTMFNEAWSGITTPLSKKKTVDKK